MNDNLLLISDQCLIIILKGGGDSLAQSLQEVKSKQSADFENTSLFLVHDFQTLNMGPGPGGRGDSYLYKYLDFVVMGPRLIPRILKLQATMTAKQ